MQGYRGHLRNGMRFESENLFLKLFSLCGDGGGACHGTSGKAREGLCRLALSLLCRGSSDQTQVTTLYPLSHILAPKSVMAWLKEYLSEVKHLSFKKLLHF